MKGGAHTLTLRHTHKQNEYRGGGERDGYGARGREMSEMLRVESVCVY